MPHFQILISFPHPTGRKYRAARLQVRPHDTRVRCSVAECADADDLAVELQPLGECIDAKVA